MTLFFRGGGGVQASFDAFGNRYEVRSSCTISIFRKKKKKIQKDSGHYLSELRFHEHRWRFYQELASPKFV